MRARWGGEEFIVFMPEAKLSEAAALAERLHAAIAQLRVPHAQGETAFTASFGVAQKDADHATLDALISAADGYLYQSKQKGRDSGELRAGDLTLLPRTRGGPTCGHA